MLGTRKPEQSMFSLLFHPELNVDGNFHTAKESVMAGPVLWQWCFAHSPGKPELSLISPVRTHVRTPSVQALLHLRSLCSANVRYSSTSAVTRGFRLLLRRGLRRGTGKMLDRNQRHRGGEKPDYSDLEGVWKKQQ